MICSLFSDSDEDERDDEDSKDDHRSTETTKV